MWKNRPLKTCVFPRFSGAFQPVIHILHIVHKSPKTLVKPCFFGIEGILISPALCYDYGREKGALRRGVLRMRVVKKGECPVTLLDNTFIDEYMAEANGEFVKVYVYLMRHASDEGSPDISAIADALNHTEKDVLRAIAYWEKKGLLTREEKPAALPAPEPLQPQGVRSLSEAERRDLVLRYGEDPEFSQLRFAVENYLGRTLKASEGETLVYLYGDLSMSAELLDYLVDYCVSNGHRRMSYMEAVALDWKSRGFLTAADAREANQNYVKGVSEVQKALGIRDRALGTAEIRRVKKWINEEHYPLELIVEACSRALLSAKTGRYFEYADKVLRGWREEGIETEAQLAERDQNRKSAAPAQVKRTQTKNRFHNFEERDEDYDQLFRKLSNS